MKCGNCGANGLNPVKAEYKVVCFKCKVCIGPNTPNIRWIICSPCNELLGGV